MRVVYFYHHSRDLVLLLTGYAKNAKADLSPKDREISSSLRGPTGGHVHDESYPSRGAPSLAWTWRKPLGEAVA